jgi:transitional endoplasmic reticulum ATPase
MSIETKSILNKGELVGDKYTINFFIKEGSYGESYRVKADDGKTYFLKLFNYAKLHRTQFDTEGNILEIEILKSINHPNLLRYKDSGVFIKNNVKYSFAVLEFISGETIADKLKRDETLSVYDAKQIISGVLNGLKYLHNLSIPVIHNEITNLNVMLDLSGKTVLPKIIDFGYARFFNQSNKSYNKEGLSPFYMAGECFNGVFSPQSDIYSCGALLYNMIFGLPPWFVEVSKYSSDRINLEEAVLQERKKPLKMLSIEGDKSFELNTDFFNIIKKALHPDISNRYNNVDEFLKAINGEIKIEDVNFNLKTDSKPKYENVVKKEFAPTEKGKGFDLIAGMDSLKDTLYNDVIRALNEKELYEEYGLTIPNGMLLYGPPGCGKTFFAQRLAEEIGFQFFEIKPSDIQSKWVNATQENIGKLFKEAEENAPSIIFIDELDAVVPVREEGVSHMNASAVNEFLARMTNSGKKGVFVIGATNRPDKIDPAIMRTGRMDKIVYLPPPDFKARVAMFKLHLKSRPLDFGIDYESLAKLTENYVSSDIEFLINEAARNALKLRSKITQQILTEVIINNKPSVPVSEIRKYEAIKDKLEGNEKSKPENNDRPSIGYKKF